MKTSQLVHLPLPNGRIMSFRNELAMSVFVVFFGMACSAAGDDAKKTEESKPRMEGKWEVTPMGQICSWQADSESSRIVISPSDRPPELWDTATGKRVAILHAHRPQQRGLMSSPFAFNGGRLLTADELESSFFRVDGDAKVEIKKTIRLWDTSDGRLLKTFEIDLSSEKLRYATDWRIEWHGKDKAFLQFNSRQNPARASAPPVLAILDLGTGKIEKMSAPADIGEWLRWSPNRERGVASFMYGVSRGQDGGISGGGWGMAVTLHLLDMVELKTIATLDDESRNQGRRTATGLAWSPDSKRVATIGDDHVVKIWEGSTGKLVATLKGHTDTILAASFAADGRRLVTASEDQTARVWNLQTGQARAVLKGHLAGLNEAVFDDVGRTVLTAGEDETARLWDAKTGKLLRTWPNHESAVRGVEFLPGRRLRTRTVRGVERTWSLDDTNRQIEEKRSGNDYRRHGALFLKDTKDGTEIWAGPRGVPGEEPTLRLSPRKTIWGRKISYAAVSGNGDVVATAAGRTLTLWHLPRWNKVTGEGSTALPGQPSDVYLLALSCDAKTLAVALTDGSASLWDVPQGKQRSIIPLPRKPVRSLAFSPDGKLLAFGGDRILFTWDVAENKPLWTAENQTGPIRCVAFSPDGRFLASGGELREWDGRGKKGPYLPSEVVLWEANTGKKVQTLGDFDREVSALAFDDHGTLAALSEDGSVRFLGIKARKQRIKKQFNDSATSLALSPDGSCLAVSGSYGWSPGVQLWNVASDKPLPVLKAGDSALRFTSDGNTLICAGQGTITVWNLADFHK